MSTHLRNCCLIALLAAAMSTAPACSQKSKQQPKAYSSSQMSNMLDQMDRGTIPNQQQSGMQGGRRQRARNIGSRGFRAKPMPVLRHPQMGGGGMGMMGGGGGGMPGMMGGGGGSKAQFLQQLMGGGAGAGMAGGGMPGGMMGGGGAGMAGGGMPGMMGGGGGARHTTIPGMVGGGRPSMMGMGGMFGRSAVRKPAMRQSMPQNHAMQPTMSAPASSGAKSSLESDFEKMYGK